MTKTATWELINPATGNMVTSYDDRDEAIDAAAWYEKTYGKRLEVVGFDPAGLAVSKESTGSV